MDTAQLGAVGTIVVGLAVAGAAFYGHRGSNRVNHAGAVLSGYGGLVKELREERVDLRTKLAEAERRLAEAYADLASERSDRARLEGEIVGLRGEIADLHRQLATMGGPT